MLHPMSDMDAKTRAWQRLQVELKRPNDNHQTAPDPKKETLLQRFQRLAKQQMPPKPASEAA
jgi:hypothetical protein